VRSVSLALTVASWLLLWSLPGIAQSRNQLWGELDVFLERGARQRFLLLVRTESDLEEGQQDIKLAANFDITIKPVLRRNLRAEDWERNHHLVARFGYQYITAVGDAERSSRENRAIVELLARMRLPADFWLTNRARVEFRHLDGRYSNRYRYRLGVEREVHLSDLTTTPFATAEIFYDTRFDTVSRERYQAGIEVVLSRRWRIEPYLLRQNNRRPEASHLNALGFKLKYYH
jgi:hypothetical protein